MPIPRDKMRLVEQFCREEATATKAYELLASKTGDKELRRILKAFAEQERRHMEFWSRVLGKHCEPYGWKLKGLSLLYKLLGPVFVLQLLERGEEDAVRSYREFLPHVDGEERKILESIIADEETHEHELLERVEDVRVKYLGYVALGLADAIVEITGVHAGFLGATSNTIMAGVAGLVVGFSAALSMAGAAYLQAKHGGETKPSTSAMVTGASYIFSVVLLALPYFLTHNMLLAFTTSLLLAFLLTGAFTFYSTVVQGKSFTREFLESATLMIGTAIGSFLFGELLGRIFGIENIET
ncbi:membrane protein [Pyrofollis japonicus]|uniref:VIT1/CCC1 transporter family protein n=1 Tax=Pyrofollis japonicus TaxID=3060460 RepID=UPI00295B0EFA|nr:rubrerythrin family protein [Pyrofollis japonicus]BEP17379.1 membrane protein [Pyrofollis japonicus]